MNKRNEKIMITSHESIKKNSLKNFQLRKFSERLKKMKEAKKPKLSIKIEKPNEELEKIEKNDPLTERIALQNQKTLIKLYNSNHVAIFENLKKDLKNNKKLSIITESDINII